MTTAPRPSIKILAAIWGEGYVRQFARFSLASFLAPGNLPALSAGADVELVLMTRQGDEALFGELPVMAAIRQYAAVRFVPIDDLIAPSVYSTTLTLAFVRGMNVFGATMTRMHFVYWNADFVLSDGGFAHLLDLINAGRKVVITGSLRAVAEQAEPLLDARRGDALTMTIPARELVALAFRFQHPHHVAKTVNQEAAWTVMASQMLWRVNSAVQLGKFFQAFMFCLQPTRVVSAINGPCDYSFVPEFCPGEPQWMIADSDDAFILELQPRDSENEFIRLGVRDEGARRAMMREWWTAEHLDTARTTVTFRAGDAPAAAVEAGKANLQAYFDDFIAPLGAPNGHAKQYYWTFGVSAWADLRARSAPSLGVPAELNATLTLEDLDSETYAALRAQAGAARHPGLLGRLRRALFGVAGAPQGIHPIAQPWAKTLKAIAAAFAGARSVLLVSNDGGLAALAPAGARVRRMEPNVAKFWRLEGSPQIDAVLIHARAPVERPGKPGEPEFDIAAALDNVAPALTDRASVAVLLEDSRMLALPDWVNRRLIGALAVHGHLEATRIEAAHISLRDARGLTRLGRAAAGLQAGAATWRRLWVLALTVLFVLGRFAPRSGGGVRAVIATIHGTRAARAA